MADSSSDSNTGGSRQVTVVKHADTSVLVHRVETALVVRTLGVARGCPEG